MGSAALDRTGIDAVAVKPAEMHLDRVAALPPVDLVVDYEGREHLPSAETLRSWADERTVRVTTPVRADGFDPLGADHLLDAVPAAVERVLVAGNPAYLTDEERSRAVAPRLGAAAGNAPSAWVGTEGVERLALATGNPQYELLSRGTVDAVRGLRAAGFEGVVAVYAPTVLTDDAAAVLDAVGAYVARRRPVASTLPEGAPTDASATGRAREVLLAASRDYALTGTPAAVRERVQTLRDAGVDTVVGYPARGLETLL